MMTSLTPLSASSRAAVRPLGPPPITITSVSAYAARSRLNPARMARVTSASLECANRGMATPSCAAGGGGDLGPRDSGQLLHPVHVLRGLPRRPLRAEHRRQGLFTEELHDAPEVVLRQARG